jgi:hypothetical protein
MHIWYEPLPPAPQQLVLEPRVKKKSDPILVREGAASTPRQPKAASRPNGDGRRKRKAEPVTVSAQKTGSNGVQDRK